MDHKAFVEGLSPEQRQNLTRKSDRAGLLHLAGHGGFILLAMIYVGLSLPLWWLVMLPLGVALVFLFTLNHEAIHRTAFASRWINDVLALICGFLLVLAPAWFRFFHFEHHRFTQDPERDPELAGSKPQSWKGYLWHVSGFPLWWGSFAVLLRNALGRNRDTFVPPSGKAKVQREALAMLAIYGAALVGSIVLGSALLLWIWVLPVVLGQPFLRLYLMAEHGRCGFVANMFENSRTTFTGPILRFLAWNMPFHAEHHAYPAVPFHKLPDLHALTRPHLKETSQGYRAFHGAVQADLD